MGSQHRAQQSAKAQYLVAELRRALGAACLLLGIALCWLFVWTLLREQYPRYVDSLPAAKPDAGGPVRSTEPTVAWDLPPVDNGTFDDPRGDEDVVAVAIPGP